MSRESFDHLAQSVYVEYRQRGFTPERALYIADSVAGQQAVRNHRRGATGGRRRLRRTNRARR